MPPRRPPYLPFLQGPPDFSPALRPIPESKWLLPDTEKDAWLPGKRILMASRPDDVVAGEVDGEAARELLSLIGETVGESPQPDWPSALEAAASLVSDDLCLLGEGDEGNWELEAAVVTAPTYWHLDEVIHTTLGGLHTPVPGGDPQLARRIKRIFDYLHPDKILERFNWTVQAEGTRFTPDPPPVEGMTAEQLFLRVERQTVRKLPETETICFTIRVCMDPLMTVLSNADVRESFEDAWLGAAPEVRQYKGWDRLEPLVREACRQAAAAG